MERLFTCVSNRLDGLERVARRSPELLATPPDAGDGAWGLSYRQGDEILGKKRPLRPGASIDVDELLRNVQTDRAIIHLGQPTPRGFSKDEVGPHRFERFAFSCIGAETLPRDGGDDVLPSLEFLARQDSAQRVFARLLTTLEREGAASEGPPAVVRDALRELVSPGANFGAIFETERRSYVYAHGIGLAHLRWDEPVGSPGANEPPFRAMVVALGEVRELSAEFRRAPSPRVFGVIGPDGALELGEG